MRTVGPCVYCVYNFGASAHSTLCQAQHSKVAVISISLNRFSLRPLPRRASCGPTLTSSSCPPCPLTLLTVTSARCRLTAPFVPSHSRVRLDLLSLILLVPFVQCCSAATSYSHLSLRVACIGPVHIAFCAASMTRSLRKRAVKPRKPVRTISSRCRSSAHHATAQD